MAVERGDCIVYVALVLAVLAAVLSAPADPSVTDQKLLWLLVQESAAETINMAGAIDGRTTFPVPP
jgi:hypothetical protein